MDVLAQFGAHPYQHPVTMLTPFTPPVKTWSFLGTSLALLFNCNVYTCVMCCPHIVVNCVYFSGTYIFMPCVYLCLETCFILSVCATCFCHGPMISFWLFLQVEVCAVYVGVVFNSI